MTNNSGAVVWQQSFGPYGTPATQVGMTPADFGYAGYYLHNRSGLNLTQTRAYSPSLGRFISRDPSGLRSGPNLYAYVSNSPVMQRDPSGLQSVQAQAAAQATAQAIDAGAADLAGATAGAAVGGILVIGGLAYLIVSGIPYQLGRDTAKHFHEPHPYNPDEKKFQPPNEKPDDWPRIPAPNANKCHTWCLNKQADDPCYPDRHSRGWLADCFYWCDNNAGTWGDW